MFRDGRQTTTKFNGKDKILTDLRAMDPCNVLCPKVEWNWWEFNVLLIILCLSYIIATINKNKNSSRLLFYFTNKCKINDGAQWLSIWEMIPKHLAHLTVAFWRFLEFSLKQSKLFWCWKSYEIIGLSWEVKLSSWVNGALAYKAESLAPTPIRDK